MKRSPMPRRKKPLQRNTPINPMSKKRAKTKRQTDPLRAAYVQAANSICESCGEQRKLECHEITAGSSRHRAVHQPNTWLALCRGCHKALQGTPFRQQLVVKCRAVAGSINDCLGRQELVLAGIECVEVSKD